MSDWDGSTPLESWLVQPVKASKMQNEKDLLAALSGDEGTYAVVWSSTGTAPALGNGTLTGTYLRTGQMGHVHIVLVAGTTTTFGTGTYGFSLPFTPVADQLLSALLQDASGSVRYAGLAWVISALGSGDNMRIIFSGEAGFANLTSTTPIAGGLATSDRIILEGWLKVAP